MLLNDLNTAAKVRDVVTIIAENVLKSQRPVAAYGTVASIDRVLKKAAVQFPGEAGTVYVPMRTIQPYDVGAVVRVLGEPGDRYIADVTGGTKGGAFIDAQALTMRAAPAPAVTQGGTIELAGGNGIGTPYASWLITNHSAGQLAFRTGITIPLNMTASAATFGVTVNFNGIEVGSTLNANAASNLYGYVNAYNTVQINKSRSGYVWSGAQMILQALAGGNTVAGFSFWVPASGVSPQVYCQGANGEVITVANSVGTSYAPIWASAFVVSSTERVKTDIVTARPAGIGTHSLPTFRHLVQAVPARTWRRKNPALVIDDEGNSREHLCGLDCDAGDGKFCSAYLNHNALNIGLVAEELAEVLPEAVTLDPDLRPMGIDLYKVIGALWAAVQELSEEVDTLKAPGPKVIPDGAAAFQPA